MSPRSIRSPSIWAAFRSWWRQGVEYCGFGPTLRRLLAELWDFIRESTPQQKRLRYGDAEYDWDYRVNTTSATVTFHDRLLGVFHSAYQPTDPAAFHQMMGAVPSGLSEFIFVDLGSGKGRTLLMASEYPFEQIVGVELLPSLSQVAEENIREYRNEAQRCFTIESVVGDAGDFTFPAQPVVLYLFNPFPETVLRRVMENLERSLRENPRPAYVLYHNPLLEHVLAASPVLRKISSNDQYALYSAQF
jgi:SAM-dependent methyltransferase